MGEVEKIKVQINKIVNKPVVCVYLRASTKGQTRDGHSLEAQKQCFKAAGTEILFTDVYTGKTTTRPEFHEPLKQVKPNDTIIVTKLDRIARLAQEGIGLINGFVERDINVNIIMNPTTKQRSYALTHEET